MVTRQLTITLLFAVSLTACSSDDRTSVTDTLLETENPVDDDLFDADVEVEINDLNIDTNSLSANGCQNVVIVDGFAYAACGNGIEAVDLETLERNFIASPADDITGDANEGVIFTQSGNTLIHFDLADPLQPEPIATVTTNFFLFSGISAADGILVVSGGSTGSNTQVYTYTANFLSLVLPGIPTVDGRTGNPDVHVTSALNGSVLAFYSQDLGAVANWGIQTVEFDENGSVLSLPEVVVLTPGQFTGSFGAPIGPANFPVESEYLNGTLYTANFAANGIEVIDVTISTVLSTIELGYEPTNITTDGESLFVVGVEHSNLDFIDPSTQTVVESLLLPLLQPVGVAASATHLAVADRTAGLIVVRR